MTDKPTPPEGYEVMLGRDAPNPLPKGMKVWDFYEKGEWTECACEEGGTYPAKTRWYAVPVQKPAANPPTPPKGYELRSWLELPDEVPSSCQYWAEERWLPSSLPGCSKGRIVSNVWYAVPVQKSAPEDPEHEKFMATMRGDSTPGTDPKKAMGNQKPQLQLIPPALNNEVAKALARGAEKYGVFNWRENRVEIMTYLGAMKRHIDQFLDGEDIDPDTGAHHLGCVGAGCAIVLDARKHGTLADNRPPKVQTA